MDVQYAKPVDVDPVSGQIVGVYGTGEQFQQVLGQTQRNLATKGRPFVTGDTKQVDKPHIRGQIASDLFPV